MMGGAHLFRVPTMKICGLRPRAHDPTSNMSVGTRPYMTCTGYLCKVEGKYSGATGVIGHCPIPHPKSLAPQFAPNNDVLNLDQI